MEDPSKRECKNMHRKHCEKAAADERRSCGIEELRKSYSELERQVELCTAEISVLKERLEWEMEERQCVENALRTGEARFKIAAQYSSDLIYEWDFSNDQVEWYGDIDGVLGYEPGEFPGTLEAWDQALHPDDRDHVIDAVKEHILNHSPFRVEYRIRRKDGTYLYWVSRGSALWDKEGNPYRWIAVATDVTESMRVEEERMQVVDEKADSEAQDDSDPELVITLQWFAERSFAE